MTYKILNKSIFVLLFCFHEPLRHKASVGSILAQFVWEPLTAEQKVTTHGPFLLIQKI